MNLRRVAPAGLTAFALTLLFAACTGGGGPDETRIPRPTISPTATTEATSPSPSTTASPAPTSSPTSSPTSTAQSRGGAAAGARELDPDRNLGVRALPSFPAGTAGKLAVVQSAPVDTVHGAPRLAIAVRNGTSAAVVSPTVVARSGGVTGTGGLSSPARIAPGGVGLVTVVFPTGADVTAKSTFTYSVRTGDHPKATSLRVDSSKLTGVTVSGTASNRSGGTLPGPFPVDVYCFDAKNKLTGSIGSFATPPGGGDSLAVAAAAPFAVGVSGFACPRYVVGVATAG